MFENQTLEVIRQRMLDNIDEPVDKRQGSVVWDLLSPAAIEFAQAYVALDLVLNFGLGLENIPRKYLVRRCAAFGITPKEALKATGQVTFTGADGTVIPAGTRLSTDDVEPIYFVTPEEGTITGGTVTVDAEAETAGAAGNVVAGKITLVVGDLSGVTSVTNNVPFDGGTDEESDESLLQRYLDRVRRPATSGNANHYRQWALEVAGGGRPKSFSGANRPGPGKGVLISLGKNTPPPPRFFSFRGLFFLKI